MKVIIPKAVTEAGLLASDVVEGDAAAWVEGTTYEKDALCMHAHHLWKSLQADNTGKKPDENADWWSDQGATNRWAMFDDKVGTVTRSSGASLTVDLDFGRCTGFALFGIDATTLTAEVFDSTDALIWSQSVDLTRNPLITSWLDYFTEPIDARTEFVATGLPLYSVSRLRITLTKPAGTVGVGNCVIGRERFIGMTKWGAEVGMSDWSRRATDSFGNTYLKPGNWAKNNRLDLHVENSQVDVVFSALVSLRGMPTVFIGDNRDVGFNALTVWGAIADFRIVIPGPSVSACSLEIQGLI